MEGFTNGRLPKILMFLQQEKQKNFHNLFFNHSNVFIWPQVDNQNTCLNHLCSDLNIQLCNLSEA